MRRYSQMVMPPLGPVKPQDTTSLFAHGSDYGRPWRSSSNASTAAMTFSSSAILRKIAVEGSPTCRAASLIKACCAPLRR